MITKRTSESRGFADHGWLQARHSFSFAEYYDPAEMGWSALRVINEDRVQPGTGFGMHGHRDMEIVTYILAGELEHRDSLGNGGVIRRGEIQYMSAGSGIRHSEFNPSQDAETHLLQIWIAPARRNLLPSYAQHDLAPPDRAMPLQLVASADGAHGSVVIGQDARLYAGHLDADQQHGHALPAGRLAYVHLIAGELDLNGIQLKAGDGAKIRDEAILLFAARDASEFLVFDLPPHP